MNLSVFNFFVVGIFAKGKTEKCSGKIDLAVVLDVSASIGEENFNLAKNFTKTLARRFKISKDNVRVSLVAYSQSVKIFCRFNENQEEEALQEKVNNIFFEASSTGTSKTLSVVNYQLFEPKSGSRIEETDVRKVAVFITDGFSFIGPEVVKLRADQMKKRGIEVFAVGITKRIGYEELTNLSSKPVKHHFFRLTDGHSTISIIDHIVNDIC